MNPIEKSILYLKEQLICMSEIWKENHFKERMNACLVIVEAINILEQRVYGEQITSISDIL